MPKGKPRSIVASFNVAAPVSFDSLPPVTRAGGAGRSQSEYVKALIAANLSVGAALPFEIDGPGDDVKTLMTRIQAGAHNAVKKLGWKATCRIVGNTVYVGRTKGSDLAVDPVSGNFLTDDDGRLMTEAEVAAEAQ